MTITTTTRTCRTGDAGRDFDLNRALWVRERHTFHSGVESSFWFVFFQQKRAASHKEKNRKTARVGLFGRGLFWRGAPISDGGSNAFFFHPNAQSDPVLVPAVDHSQWEG